MLSTCIAFTLFFFNDPATTEIYTLSLHDALPISPSRFRFVLDFWKPMPRRKYAWEQLTDEQLLKQRLSSLRVAVEGTWLARSEEHTSELQSQSNLVCRLLLEKKKQHKTART